MRKFKITVNGTEYEVEVEETTGVATEATSTAPKAAPAAPKAAPAPVAKTAPAAGTTAVTAPMKGTIVGVNVKVGDAVKRGDVVFVLEAMKMENEIFAPVDGTVAELLTSKGAAVESDAVLLTIK